MRKLSRCPNCKCKFLPANKLQICCSRKCSHHRQRATRITKKCLYCSKPYQSRKSEKRKYCSPDCAKRARRGAKYHKALDSHIDKRYHKMPWLTTYCIQRKGQCSLYCQDAFNEIGCFGKLYNGKCYQEPQDMPEVLLRSNFRENIYLTTMGNF